jgi:hypothetical protein
LVADCLVVAAWLPLGCRRWPLKYENCKSATFGSIFLSLVINTCGNISIFAIQPQSLNKHPKNMHFCMFFLYLSLSLGKACIFYKFYGTDFKLRAVYLIFSFALRSPFRTGSMKQSKNL